MNDLRKGIFLGIKIMTEQKLEYHIFYILDENKNVVPGSLQEFDNLFGTEEGNEKRRVGLDVISDKEVSTVFLGTPYFSLSNDEVLFFETMVFAEKNHWRDIYMDRYSTWQEAEQGHKKAIQWVKNGCKDE